MFHVDVFLLMHDTEINKIVEYNSATSNGGVYTIKHAEEALGKIMHNRTKYEYVTDKND